VVFTSLGSGGLPVKWLIIFRSEVIKAIDIKETVCEDVMCSFVDIYQYFGLHD
jgi:hypothetical protein